MFDLGVLGMNLMNAAQNNSDLGQGILSALLSSKKKNTGEADKKSLNKTTESIKPSAEPATEPDSGNSYLPTLKDSVEKAYPDNPVMQKVALTQAILESGLLNKPSTLSSKYNNLFGIKAPGTAGTVDMPSTEFIGGSPQRVTSSFGANNTIGDSFLQHRDLMNKNRYAPVLSAGSPYEAFSALQRVGYATDPRYAQKLASLYDKYVVPLYV